MNNSIALQVEKVSKSYKLKNDKSLLALDGVTFDVKQGEIFGFWVLMVQENLL